MLIMYEKHDSVILCAVGFICHLFFTDICMVRLLAQRQVGQAIKLSM